MCAIKRKLEVFKWNKFSFFFLQSIYKGRCDRLFN